MSGHAIAWCIPVPLKGSGGFRTIFRKAQEFSRRGYMSDFYIVSYDCGIWFSPETIERDIREWFDYVPDHVYVADALVGEYDACIATAWSTARFVARQSSGCKLYFVQDYEPWFYPMEYNEIEAEYSYRFGLRPITIGRWLSHKIAEQVHHAVPYCEFGADDTIYHPIEGFLKERAVCAIYQPEKNRRLPGLLMDAIRVLLMADSSVHVYLYGANDNRNYPRLRLPRVTYLNLLSAEDCNKLYNRCSCGISLSGSNPSRIPFEMMAAGLPTIEMYRENNLYDFPEGSILLVEPKPSSIASSVLRLLDDCSLASSLRASGAAFMRRHHALQEDVQFCDAAEAIIAGEPIARNQVLTRQYALAPAETPAEFLALEDSLYYNREQSARASCLPLVGSVFKIRLIPRELRSDGEYRVGVWYKADQADLVWEVGVRDGDAFVISVVPEEVPETPVCFNLHFYYFAKGEAPTFLGGITQIACAKTLEPLCQSLQERSVIEDGFMCRIWAT